MGIKLSFLHFPLTCHGLQDHWFFFAPKIQATKYFKLVLFLLGPICFLLLCYHPFTRIIFQVDSMVEKIGLFHSNRLFTPTDS